ncbi:MAG: hypoxanthine phosphoribosyltransferase [Acidimicrobiia bacterium]|nr:hypoxanthine phosphoribosyltransferase [Acidimicrobiia bacterium]MDH4308074.1 hypoxanthine phosphoribosyltransferase [Acidimicrobiia bacterium]
MEGGDVVTKVIDARDLSARAAELGAALTQDYHGTKPVFVTVMSGALWFVADLVRQVDLPVEVDFLMLNRFGEGGRIRIATDTATALTGRDVILVEDIVDTGLTLTVLRKLIAEREPASLKTVALIDKVPRRLVDVPIEYRGFEVGDEYLVGYGLDHRGLYRNLADIWAVLDLEAFQAAPDALARVALTGS